MNSEKQNNRRWHFILLIVFISCLTACDEIKSIFNSNVSKLEYEIKDNQFYYNTKWL